MPVVFAVGAGLGCFFFIIIYSFIFSYETLFEIKCEQSENGELLQCCCVVFICVHKSSFLVGWLLWIYPPF